MNFQHTSKSTNFFHSHKPYGDKNTFPNIFLSPSYTTYSYLTHILLLIAREKNANVYFQIHL